MFYEAILKTGNKTSEQLREKALQESWIGELTNKDVKEMMEYYNTLDGLKVIVGEAVFGEGYTLIAWGDEADEKIKEAFYLMEQDGYFGAYIDDRERFERDWESKDYDNNAGMNFDKDDVEIISALGKKDS
ncbi:hypothetical protein [Aminipila terrae]|uniref:Uncharacterized protein n=1 Tax=Aminipila terrae TaxID=2697030 RepID=A0A6P1MNV8_9FIRM|nr:hypothetical protein [Aminipila terrae]QHI73798.1 hypothetical protein Ami3637_16675 [Aminipila terrae]